MNLVFVCTLRLGNRDGGHHFEVKGALETLRITMEINYLEVNCNPKFKY